MLKIGLTGGIGSGKTTVCQYFEALGVPIIDADIVSHTLTQAGHPAIKQIAHDFGADSLRQDGSLNREYLRQQIFSDETQRHKLESILHPLIRKAILDQLDTMQAPYVIIAVPLLIERGWQDLVDRVLVIDSSVEQQIQRGSQRDGASEQNIRSIIRTQTDRQTRIQAADDIIVNDSSLNHLKEQVTQLHQCYLDMADRYQAATQNGN